MSVKINLPKWQSYQLGDLFQIKHGYAFQSAYFANQGEYILLTPGNFYEEGGFRAKGASEKYYTGDFPQEYLLKQNDLLIVMTEQAAGLLGSSLLVPTDNRYLHNQRLGLVWGIEETKLNKSYLYHLFNSQDVREQIHVTASGTKVRHTSPSKIYQVEIHIPSIHEQQKIAEILSTCDKAIDLTEQLIAAKQRRKQGIMQLLLSGKLRFPEFEGDGWKEIELKDVVKINQNNLPESSNPEKEYYYIDLSAVDTGTIHLPTQKQRFGDLPSRARRVLHPNDIIMATVRPHLLGYARCTFDTTETLCSTGFSVITPNKPEYIDFIYQSLYSSSIQQQIAALVTGSNYPAINASQVGKLKMVWPLSDQERRKVADLLTFCDDEIDFLQQKLTALRQQKLGLMQQLLTGKIRVKV